VLEKRESNLLEEFMESCNSGKLVPMGFSGVVYCSLFYPSMLVIDVFISQSTFSSLATMTARKLAALIAEIIDAAVAEIQVGLATEILLNALNIEMMMVAFLVKPTLATALLTDNQRLVYITVHGLITLK
jgi:hypothetical protein